MRAKLIASGEHGRTFALAFDKGDEVIARLTAFAGEEGLAGSHLSAIGAFSRATLAYFDRERREYLPIPIEEQVEVVSLLGNVAHSDGGVKVHAHAVVGYRDGSVRGGHLLEGQVWPTLEVVLTESPEHLQRRSDPATGLALLAP